MLFLDDDTIVRLLRRVVSSGRPFVPAGGGANRPGRGCLCAINLSHNRPSLCFPLPPRARPLGISGPPLSYDFIDVEGLVCFVFVSCHCTRARRLSLLSLLLVHFLDARLSVHAPSNDTLRVCLLLSVARPGRSQWRSRFARELSPLRPPASFVGFQLCWLSSHLIASRPLHSPHLRAWQSGIEAARSPQTRQIAGVQPRRPRRRSPDHAPRSEEGRAERDRYRAIGCLWFRSLRCCRRLVSASRGLPGQIASSRRPCDGDARVLKTISYSRLRRGEDGCAPLYDLALITPLRRLFRCLRSRYTNSF